MYIYQKVSFSTFYDAFQATRPDNFSYEGLRVLFDILEDQANDMGEPIELDIVALCCEWSEASLDEVNEDYSLVDAEDYQNDDEGYHEAIFEALNERTTAYHVDSNTVVYQQF